MKLRHKLETTLEVYSATLLLEQVIFQLELYLYTVKAVCPRHRLGFCLNNLQSVHLYLLLAMVQFQVFQSK